MSSTKAFDLHLLVGRENIMGNKPKVMIESMEICNKNLYAGTNDGTLYHFLLLEDVAQGNTNNSNERGPGQISAFLQAQKRIGTKKAIVQIKAATELKCLLINSDGLIQAYSMLDLSPVFAMLTRVKNVNRFYVNEHPIHADPFSIEVCVSYIKKKHVQLYQVNEESMVPLKEFSFSEPPISLALDGHFMCVGTSSGYVMLDTDTSTRQELLPAGENKLFVHRVAPAEFLLAAPNSLGVFVTSAGISQRAPIQWSGGIFKACFLHPYVVAMDADYITVHSIVDQQQKQTVPFQGGLQLIESNKRVLICTNKDIFVLSLVPFETQVSNLLAERKVQQAMDLAKECRKSMPRQQFYDMMQMTYRKAGFVYMKDLDFQNAEKMFDTGKIDSREIVSLYPDIIPSDSRFVRSAPPYHNIASINNMCGGSKERISKSYEFLAQYLQNHPLTPQAANKLGDTPANPFAEQPLEETPEYRGDIFRSCVNIFAKQHLTGVLLRLFQGEHKPLSRSIPARSQFFHEFQNYSEEIAEVLLLNECYHTFAIYRLINNDLDHSMSTWKELATGSKIDLDFPGLAFVAETLGHYCQDINLLWKHAEWILRLDEHIGVSIFTAHVLQPQDEATSADTEEIACRPKVDDIIDYLHHYQEPIVAYLEHLIFVCRIQKEKYHTHLAVLYLDNVLKLKNQNTDDETLQVPRLRLQRLLKESNMYRIALILGKVNDNDLHAESVILHGKLGEHEKALDILVNKMKDREAAEKYCMEQSTDAESKRELFERLLSVYLSKLSAGSSKSSKSAMAVTDILNKYGECYDPQKVMNVLPKEWSVTLLNQFLSRTMRLGMHNLHTSYLELMLGRCENNNTRKDNIQLLNKNVRITEDKICQVCNRLFQSADCVVYPNGVAVHPHCGTSKHLCPVTGKLFKTLPAPKH